MVYARRSAFTLLELVLVVTIIALLAMIAYPSLDSMYTDFKLTSAVDQVRAAWALGRVQAMNDGRPYRFGVVPGMGNYRLAPDSSEFWSGSGGAASSNEATDQPVIIQDALPKGVRLALLDQGAPADTSAAENTVLPSASVDAGQYQGIVTFLPDGTSREDVRIVFSTKGARPVVLTLRGITGAVSVRPLTDSEK